MNNGGYQVNPVFPNQSIPPAGIPQQFIPPTQPATGQLPMEQTYLENILRMNIGKVVKLHVTFSGSNEWLDKTFPCIIEAVGIDHIITSDPKTGEWHIIKTLYLNFLSCEEKLNFNSNEQ